MSWMDGGPGLVKAVYAFLATVQQRELVVSAGGITGFGFKANEKTRLGTCNGSERLFKRDMHLASD